MHVVEQLGPFVVLPALFLIVGVGIFINITWGLVTGGPRAFQEPGAPYLYSRGYYLLFLFTLVGWSGALIGVVSEINSDRVGYSFILGWGICAIGMGSLLSFWRPMMLRGSRYLSVHGIWLFRFFHHAQVGQLMRLENPPTQALKFLPFLFISAGTIAVVISLFHLPSAIGEVGAGARIMFETITAS
jgi:hypothetical protein